MKHVDELAIIGVFLKAVKISGVPTTQGRNYLGKRRLFSLAFVTHILQNSYGGKIAAEHGMVKAKGSWVTQDTPAKKHTPPPPPRPPPCIHVVRAYGPFSLHFTQRYR